LEKKYLIGIDAGTTAIKAVSYLSPFTQTVTGSNLLIVFANSTKAFCA